MDNKRNGSGPPPPPRNGGRQPTPPGRAAPFQFTDDDDEPAPQPGESFPELAADLVDDEAAAEDGEIGDSGLIQDQQHRPPPPSPLRERRGAFLDDGEIALPPGLSQVVRSQASRFPFRDVVDDDDAELGAALTPADDEPAPPWADDDDDSPAQTPASASSPDAPTTTWSKAPVLKARPAPGEEDDFGELNDQSRRLVMPDLSRSGRRPAREEDDFGDLNEPSRAFAAARPRTSAPERDAPTVKRRVDSAAVGAAIDQSGLAPALEVTLHPIDDPLPPPPMAQLADDETLPPLIATHAAQSGVAFTRAGFADEPAPPPDESEPTRPLSALAVSQDSLRQSLLTPIRVADIDDDDDDDGDSGDSIIAPVRLAPPPSEPLGEPFPLDLWSDPDELIGRDIGRWRLVKPLTHGITSRVYAAVDEQEDGRHVAVRVLGPMHSPTGRRGRQFLFEAQQLAKLRHESIVEVLDAGITADHLTYYVMEQVEGDSLAAVLRAEGPLAWQQVAILFTQICEALTVAADKGIVATDLNLGAVVRLHTSDDEARRREPIKLLGVGIAPVASTYRSAEGLVESKGTPAGQAEYMAPELASGGIPGEATSVYALGVMMYELLTGRTPFRGDSFLSIIKKQMYDEPNAPRLVVPQQEIAEPFEEVVLGALAKDPSRRYASIRELHEAILAARAREGELRRATAILALDPTDWDEETARRAEPPEARAAAAQVEPQPLATFTADLRQRDPALAAAVLDAPPPPAARPVRSTPVPLPRVSQPSEPRAIPIPPQVRNASPSGPAARPEPSMILSHLAPPIRAPEPVLPRPKTAPLPVIVVSPPVAPAASPNFIRNVSLAVILGAALVSLFLMVSRRQPTPARKDDPVVEAPRRAKDTPRPRKPTRDTRSTKTVDEAQPIVVGASGAAAPQPVPEAIPEPPPQPVPAAIPEPPPQPAPEPTPAVVAPTPEPEPPPVAKPEPTPPPVAKAEPPPVAKTEPAKAKPKPPKPDNSDLPLRIEPTRLKSYFNAMAPRVVKACGGNPAAAGTKVTVKITVDVNGNVKAAAQDKAKGTTLGNCVENFVESSRFNETQKGGSHTHVFGF
ncbi:protein kinase domain-containing protein [Nannocystis radixulma]|uniref:Protein kinase n=1 Tax=Nannocystis radixulma TaxID=2995305 RepID=A0ABT5B4T2_9BACT|nr:protein kinase [Nannocystis radixulma]MDC0668483.1 protein kinase [Nannocystis radixulma]